jgi:hypothetical protein
LLTDQQQQQAGEAAGVLSGWELQLIMEYCEEVSSRQQQQQQ